MHVSSPTTSLSCGTYTNTATFSAFNGSGGAAQQDTASTTVVGCPPTALTVTSFGASRKGRSLRLRPVGVR